MVTVYGYPKCSTCKKAMKFLQEKKVPVELIDIVKNTPSAEQIASWIEASELPIRRFFNTSGMRYRELGLKDKVDGYTLKEACEVLASDGMLLKRPILLKGGQFVVNGFNEQTYEGVLASWKKNV
jgi:arsenate reductase